jgi:hypothetical protein
MRSRALGERTNFSQSRDGTPPSVVITSTVSPCCST